MNFLEIVFNGGYLWLGLFRSPSACVPRRGTAVVRPHCSYQHYSVHLSRSNGYLSSCNRLWIFVVWQYFNSVQFRFGSSYSFDFVNCVRLAFGFGESVQLVFFVWSFCCEDDCYTNCIRFSQNCVNTYARTQAHIHRHTPKKYISKSITIIIKWHLIPIQMLLFLFDLFFWKSEICIC